MTISWPIALAIAVSVGRAAPHVQDGDIIFHTSRSSQSLAIQKATHSPYSHMGLILYRGGSPYVFEAVGTVRYTPLARWVRRRMTSRSNGVTTRSTAQSSSGRSTSVL